MAEALLPLEWNGSTLAIPRASATQDGYLSREDYILFATSGGSSVPVTSFNTRTGDIILFEDDVLAALGYVPLNKHGDTMTGPLLLPAGTPSSSLAAVTKQYVDSHSTGLLKGDVLLSSFNASGSPATYTGSVTASSKTLTVNIATDFAVGQGIYIANAGTGGTAAHITKVDAVSGTTITLHDAAPATATNRKVQHDDTDAIQAAFDAIKASNGGRILAGAGVFKVNKPPTLNNAILNLPFVPNPDTSTLYIKSFSLVGNQPFIAGHFTPHDPEVVTATVIETELRDVNAWIMVGGLYTTTYGAGNHAYIYLENIIFRTYDDPQINCLDLATCWGVALKGVGCDSGLGVQAMTYPSHDTIGVRLPMLNTNSIAYTELLCVRGYGIGVVGSELWHSYNTWVEHCKVGVQTHDSTANYPIVGDFLIGSCTTGIYCKTKARLDIQVTYEIAPSGPYLMGYAIHDPTDISVGIMRYYAYNIGNASAAEVFCTGCSGVTIWSIEGFGIKWATGLP